MPALPLRREPRTREPPVAHRSERDTGAPEERTGWQYEWTLGGRRLWRPSGWRLGRVALLAVGDVGAAAVALGLSLLPAGVGALPELWGHLLPLTVVLTMLGQGVAGTYGSGIGRRRYGRSALAGVLAAATMAVLAVPYPSFLLPAPSLVLLGVLLGGLLPVVRMTAEAALGFCHDRGWLRLPALMVMRSPAGFRAGSWLERHGYRGFDLRGVWAIEAHDEDGGSRPSVPLVGLGDRIDQSGARVVLVPRALDEESFRAVAYHCFLHGAELRVLPAWRDRIPFQVVDQDEYGMARVELAVPQLRLVERMLKRTLDVLLAGVGVLLLAPVYAAIAVAIRLDSPGPALFRQERLGRGGRRFRLLKFRSMRRDAEERLRADDELFERYVANDYKLPVEEDPRVTRIGGFLRSTSLDELPQLLNVLKGDMSLVGPRPVVPPEIEEFGVYAPVVLGVRPGVTGYWQITGRNAVGYPERARREIEYVENWSLWLDFAILARTVPVVLRKMGVV